MVVLKKKGKIFQRRIEWSGREGAHHGKALLVYKRHIRISYHFKVTFKIESKKIRGDLCVYLDRALR